MTTTEPGATGAPPRALPTTVPPTPVIPTCAFPTPTDRPEQTR